MSSDAITLTICFACAGNWHKVVEKGDGRYKTEVCPWCIRGSQSTEQIKAWHAREKK